MSIHLQNKKYNYVSLLGAGNIAQALIKGLVLSKQLDPANITIFDLDSTKTSLLKRQYGITIAQTHEELTKRGLNYPQKNQYEITLRK